LHRERLSHSRDECASRRAPVQPSDFFHRSIKGYGNLYVTVQLFGRQGGRDRLHQSLGPRGRTRRHHRQRNLSGLHRDRHGQGDAGGGIAEKHPAADPDRAAGRAGRNRALRGVSGVRRRRVIYRVDTVGEWRAILRLIVSALPPVRYGVLHSGDHPCGVHVRVVISLARGSDS
jgi:hypothetical protein